MALVAGIMDTVRDSAQNHGISRINSIKLVIGKLSMALPDSLEFAFECLRGEEGLFAQAVLEIEETKLIGRCRGCREELTLQEIYDQCPVCADKSGWDLLSGRELYIDSYEGD